MTSRREGEVANAVPVLLHTLLPDEELDLHVDLQDATLALTNRRVIVTTNDRVSLNIPYRGLRRIEFDVERRGPATLALVPDSPADGPQVLVVPPAACERAAHAVARICERLESSPGHGA